MVPLPLLTIRHNIGIVNPFCLVFQPLLCPLHPKSLSPTSAGGMYVALVNVIVGHAFGDPSEAKGWPQTENTPPLFSIIWDLEPMLIVDGYSEAVAAGVEAGSLTLNVIDNSPPGEFAVIPPSRATRYRTSPSAGIMLALDMN